jgi:para-aminobenzoate synthetase component I
MQINFENKQALYVAWQWVLAWANQFEQCCCLESNAHQAGFRKMIGAGVLHEIKIEKHTQSPEKNAFQQLQDWQESHKDWAFGVLSYDLKNELEDLTSTNFDGFDAPLLHFFVPLYQFEFVDLTINFTLRNDRVGAEVWQEIVAFGKRFSFGESQENKAKNRRELPSFILNKKIMYEDYMQTFFDIKKDIIAGDYYEINFCQAFYQNRKINPLLCFFDLNDLTQSPFACYYRHEKNYLVGASPERFLQKKGRKLESNPIKGTARRGKNEAEDAALKAALLASEKDRAENVMIVDLVRNDLARCCETGSVKVPELCAIYSYPQVHQMISTVTGTLRENLRFSDALMATFPMGSMTGAPKIMTMQRIEYYESTKRGWYSGAVGYITPDADFDFNVVIRSIFYNAETDYLATQVGGAIVYDSNMEDEYAECLLKAKAVCEVLNASIM